MNVKRAIVCLLLVGCAAWCGAQTIAIHPLWGEPAEITAMFYDVLLDAVQDAPGSFSSYPIDLMFNRPDDVPEGGFPPYICPSPSLTRGAPYALTGEVGEGTVPDEYRLRVYLWQMNGARLLVSDEMTASDRDSFEAQLPYFLQWIVSDDNIDPPSVRSFGPENWLYLGLRAGGNFFYTYKKQDDDFIRPDKLNLNFDAAFQITAHLLPFLDIKLEPTFTVDVTGDLIVDLYVPVLFQLTVGSGRMKAGLFAGAYPLYVPLLNDSDDEVLEYGLLGIIAGVNIGWKLGPGYLFVDARYDYDKHWNKDATPHHRNILKASLGYELGLINKKQK